MEEFGRVYWDGNSTKEKEVQWDWKRRGAGGVKRADRPKGDGK